MSGHSKWASIKHKKAATDAKRGKLFTKLARAITVAAREGGGDPDGNPALGLAIQKAKEASMPKDNIGRAIDRGTGEGADADAIERVLYEGYGPGGVAILVEAMTDNRNRTGSDVRHAFDRHGGNLGEPGSVSYLFEKRGLIVVLADRVDEDEVMLVAIEAGAEDVEVADGELRIETVAGELQVIQAALLEAAVKVASAEIAMVPSTTVTVESDKAATLIKLIDLLDDHDDVDSVHANFDISDEVLEQITR